MDELAKWAGIPKVVPNASLCTVEVLGLIHSMTLELSADRIVCEAIDGVVPLGN